MKRCGPPKRKTPLRRAPFRKAGKAKHVSSYRRRERFTDYMAWVRTQPCIVGWLAGDWLKGDPGRHKTHVYLHRGDVEADHAGERAMGRKAHDSTCISLCRNHHDQRTNGWGMFVDFTLADKRAWKILAIAAMQARARAAGITVPEVT